MVRWGSKRRMGGGERGVEDGLSNYGMRGLRIGRLAVFQQMEGTGSGRCLRDLGGMAGVREVGKE